MQLNLKQSHAMTIESLREEHRVWVQARTDELFNGRFVVSRGAMHEPARLPGFVALNGSEPVGLATFHLEGDSCELVTIDALVQWQGIGSALLAAVEREAAKAGCRRIWLITTNDNVDALRFYQKRGYAIVGIYPKALEQSRKLKPTIPRIGSYGIPIDDEIELEKHI